MHTLSRMSFIVLMGVVTVALASWDSLAQEIRRENKGSISGLITLEGKPAPRVTVMLIAGRSDYIQPGPPPVRVTTDEEGRYRFTGVVAGKYSILPSTPAFVASGNQGGQSLSLLEGEEVEDINFTLAQGGVITGRVTDGEGKPIIRGYVNLMRLNEQGRLYSMRSAEGFKYVTDDRGVYRVYGVLPGSYKVSFGVAADDAMSRPVSVGGGYALTFHPNVSDESRSPTIEVTAGSEATGIDITVGRPTRTYVATGRIIDAETGAPVSDLQYGYGSLFPNGRMGARGWSNNKSNSKGEFRIEGLRSGRFAAVVLSPGPSESYGEPAVFEVADSDVNGLEIKVRPGSSISGVAVIEGAESAEVLALLAKVQISAYVQSQSVSAPWFAPAKLEASRSFRIGGLQPGKVWLDLSTNPPIAGLSLLRVERDGVEQPGGIDLGGGEHLTGIRLVIGYGTGVIRGQVKIQGREGPLPVPLVATVRRVGGTRTLSQSEIDVRGRFKIEGLSSGEYEVTVIGNLVLPGGGRAAPVSQNVTVVNGSEMEVTLVLSASPRGKDNEK